MVDRPPPGPAWSSFLTPGGRYVAVNGILSGHGFVARTPALCSGGAPLAPALPLPPLHAANATQTTAQETRTNRVRRRIRGTLPIAPPPRFGGAGLRTGSDEDEVGREAERETEQQS